MFEGAAGDIVHDADIQHSLRLVSENVNEISLGHGLATARFPLRAETLLPWKLQSHLAVALRVVAPAFAHLDEQKEMDRVLDRHRDVGARRGADRFDDLAALAEHDLALAFALDIDG